MERTIRALEDVHQWVGDPRAAGKTAQTAAVLKIPHYEQKRRPALQGRSTQGRTRRWRPALLRGSRHARRFALNRERVARALNCGERVKVARRFWMAFRLSLRTRAR